MTLVRLNRDERQLAKQIIERSLSDVCDIAIEAENPVIQKMCGCEPVVPLGHVSAVNHFLGKNDNKCRVCLLQDNIRRLKQNLEAIQRSEFHGPTKKETAGRARTAV